MAALRLLFGHRSGPDGDRRAEQCRDSLTSGAHDPAGLFVARDAGGRVSGAVLAQAMPGALGVAWPPRAGSPETADALVRAACDWLRSRGVKVCQAFASADELPDMAPLERNGFRHVTQLAFLRRNLDPDADRLRAADQLEGYFYLPALRDQFVVALLATHERTLDCPELEGSRTAEEVVAGFDFPDRSSGQHFVVEVDGTPAGISITDVSPDGVFGINYLGLIPAVRGRGIGGKLLRKVLYEGSLVASVAEVSVDARNEPALRLYRRHGFAETDRREVFLAHLPGAGRPG